MGKASISLSTVIMMAVVGLPVGVGCVASAVGCYRWLLVGTGIGLKLIILSRYGKYAC